MLARTCIIFSVTGTTAINFQKVLKAKGDGPATTHVVHTDGHGDQDGGGKKVVVLQTNWNLKLKILIS